MNLGGIRKCYLSARNTCLLFSPFLSLFEENILSNLIQLSILPLFHTIQPQNTGKKEETLGNWRYRYPIFYFDFDFGTMDIKEHDGSESVSHGYDRYVYDTWSILQHSIA